MESPESPTGDQILRDETNFIQNVSQFYNQEALSDVILRVAEDRYFGHKFVLAKSSDVFRTMLYERPWSQNVQDEVVLNETPECQMVFGKFLRYLYTAEIQISTSSAIGILCLADKYNVDSLKELCTHYMVDNSRSPKVRNALHWYSWAKALHLDGLIEQCTKTIAWNVQEIISSKEWLQMDVEFLCDMLQSSELVVPNEFSLFEAVAKWLNHETHCKDIESHAQKLLPLIRFPQMLVTQLYQLEHSSLASTPSTQDLLLSLMGRAYRFRALCPSQSHLGINFDEPFFLPRDYVELIVDNVRMQNTLRFGIQVDVKMYRGPVPSEIRDGDWKITYRKQSDVWTMQIYCHETAMINNEAHFQTTIIVYNEQDKVIQVQRAMTFTYTRGNNLTVTIQLEEPELAKNMAVLIKPVPY